MTSTSGAGIRRSLRAFRRRRGAAWCEDSGRRSVLLPGQRDLVLRPGPAAMPAISTPLRHGRGFELKVQLARAAIAAMHAILDVDPRARFVHCDPAINVVTDPGRPHERWAAEGHRQAQFQAWDMIAGRAGRSSAGAGPARYRRRQLLLQQPVDPWRPADRYRPSALPPLPRS